jgi:phosphate/sulfate permease
MNILSIILIALAVLGLFISKEFRYGLITMIGSAIVFTPVIAIGIPYTILYSLYMPFKEKDWKVFFKIWWRVIDGTYAYLGDTMTEGFSIRYDELGNVWGEWLEDSITVQEKTSFGDRQTTISASVGYLEYYKIFMFKRGRDLSKTLNIAFRQKRHAIGSWEKKLALKELEDKNLHGNIKK